MLRGIIICSATQHSFVQPMAIDRAHRAAASPSIDNSCTIPPTIQFESIAGRWEESDFGLLQPVVPGPGLALLLAHGAMQTQAAKSEQDLLFRSGAARAASGASVAVITSAVEEQT
jgi:hypothetical protein